MGITEDIADQLAQDALKAADDLGDANLIAQLSAVIGAASQTTQEAFMTAVRVRMSERRAREFLAQKIAKGPADPSKVGNAMSGRLLDPTEDNPSGH